MEKTEPAKKAAGSGIDAQKLAERAAGALFDRDRVSQGLGISLDHVAPGEATLSMTVRDDMLQGHETCHGGVIFTLADAAFALACNSHNRRTVAAGADIAFLKPAHLGDRLTASGRESHRAGRSGIYDIAVVNQHGDTIALFRGRSRTLNGEVAPDEAN